MLWSPQQETALSLVSAWQRDNNNPVFMLAGYAGTGKTTLARHLAACTNGVVYFAAYTGKAAHVLRQAGCDNVSTIHRLIYLPKEKCRAHLVKLEAELADLRKKATPPAGEVARLELAIREEMTNLQRPAWTLNTDSPLKDAALLVIDEYSMVDRQMGEDLLSFGCPILALGDPGQLPPVWGQPFFARRPDFFLTEIHRQAADNPIIRLSREVREGGNLRPGQYGESLVVRYANLDKEEIGRMALGCDQLLVGRNATRRACNRRLRELLGRKDVMPEVGDKLICLRNNHQEGLLNGQMWKVASAPQADRDFLVLDIENEEGEQLSCLAHPNHFAGTSDQLDYWTRKDAEEFDYGYAITVHKCVHPDTLVETDQGLLPIRDISEEGMVATPNGGERYTNKVHNPEGPALSITCEDGYNITATPDHRVEVFREGDPYFVFARDVREGDWMRVRLGNTVEPQNKVILPVPASPDVRCRAVRIPEIMTPDLAEFFGLVVADGTVTKSLVRLVKRHNDVAERFRQLAENLFDAKPNRLTCYKNALGYEIDSTTVSRWLLSVGGMGPNNKNVPLCILRADMACRSAFLRGLFEDACVNVKNGLCDHIQFVTKYTSIKDRVQALLLQLGIVSGSIQRNGAWSVYIYGNQAAKYREFVGFVSAFKRDRLAVCRTTNLRYRVPLSEHNREFLLPDHLFHGPRVNAQSVGYASRSTIEMVSTDNPDRIAREAAKELLRWHWVRVKSVAPTTCESMCIEVLPGHRFLQNGFPHGNSQGSQFEHIVLFDEWHRPDRQQWLYTAITRASERVTVIQM